MHYNNSGLYSDEGLSTVVIDPIHVLTHLHILWHEAVSIASLVDLLFLDRTRYVGLRAVLKHLTMVQKRGSGRTRDTRH